MEAKTSKLHCRTMMELALHKAFFSLWCALDSWNMFFITLVYVISLFGPLESIVQHCLALFCWSSQFNSIKVKNNIKNTIIQWEFPF